MINFSLKHITCWYHSKGSCLYLYLPNWHANVVRYDDFSSSLNLWYPELATISERYLTLLSFGNISFRVVPLCTGLISAWFNHAGSRHSLTLPLPLGTSAKLLHHSDVSFTSRGAIISCWCSISNSSWNGFCNVYATCLSGAWYGLLSGLSCKGNVPSKHPMSLKHHPSLYVSAMLTQHSLFCHCHKLDLQENTLLIYYHLLWPLALCYYL